MPFSPQPIIVSHALLVSLLFMKILILGGTTEANALAHALHQQNIPAIYSYAGRVARPKGQPIPTRSGGFGGVAGLVDYLTQEQITHIVDATHPFAQQMSRNAIAAATQTSTPLVAFTRPAWQATLTDQWQSVASIEAAVETIEKLPPQRIMLAIGRMHLHQFTHCQQHFFLLRLVDKPDAPLPFQHAQAIIDRGPFTAEADTALLKQQGIELIVSKNAGGTAAQSKLIAARELGIPILMIERPVIPERNELFDLDAVIDWLHTDV